MNGGTAGLLDGMYIYNKYEWMTSNNTKNTIHITRVVFISVSLGLCQTEPGVGFFTGVIVGGLRNDGRALRP